MPDESTYPQPFARFYDVIYSRLRTIDRDYFLGKILETRGPVLEIGVGTGRFFLDALNKGADIYGIDISPTMLDQLKSKLDRSQHHRIFHQDVRTLNINKKFDLALAPFRVFSHLLRLEDQLQALNSIHDHLNPGGTFIFDLFVPDLRLLLEGVHEQTDFDGEYAPGKKLRRIVSNNADLINQISHITMTLIWDEGHAQKTETWNVPMRFYFRYELEHLVRRSRLALSHIYGDYEEHELGKESKDFIVVCERR